MNSRERVRLALDHREPDRVPFDLGSTIVTGIHIGAYRDLRRHLGLPDTELRIANLPERVAEVDEDVADVLCVDARSAASVSMFVHGLDTINLGDYTGCYDEYGIG